jgi:hypothetical protein
VSGEAGENEVCVCAFVSCSACQDTGQYCFGVEDLEIG